MSYALNLQEEGIDSHYMVVVSPKREVTGWILHSGSVYKVDFDYGFVSQVFVDGTELDEGVSPSLSASEYYYDEDEEILYIRTPTSGNPSSNFVVVSFDFYIATFDKHWHRNPLDDTTTNVYWEPAIERPPNLKAASSEVLFGFMPVQTSSIVITNLEHIFERILYDSSFNRAKIRIYHLLDELEVDNIKLIYDGLMSDVSYDQGSFTVKCFDGQDLLNTEWRNPAGSSFYTTALFAGLDPSYVNRPIRYVYGMVNGFIPINVDYVAENPTTSDNRDWCVISGQTSINEISETVGGGTHTTTRTYVADASGFLVGDSVWLDRAVGSDEYVLLTNVDYISNYIEHAAIASPMVDGDLAKRSFVGNITIVQNNVAYKPLFGRDYSSSLSMAGTTIGFSFSTSLEANLSMPNTLGPADQVFCRVYGRKNDVTLGGPAFGSDDVQTDNLTNPVVILIDLLKKVGISESRINQSSFTSIVSSANKPHGFSLPKTSFDDFPTYKDIIINILTGITTRMFLDSDLKWKVSLLQPMGASSKTIEDDEILKNSFEYNFEYQDVLSEAIVDYAFRERSDDIKIFSSISSKASSTSDVARYLHGVNKQKTFETYLMNEVDADELADRLSFVFGDRKGTLVLRAKNRFFDMLLNDVLTVSRTKLPGFAYDGETVFDRDLAIIETDKSLRNVKLTLDDQKGIEDNSGSW